MSNTGASANTISPTEPIPTPSVTIASVRSEYEQADRFYTEVQSFRSKAGIPALNELRNAGKHLLDALGDEGSVANATDLQSALIHCRRAAYEAYEAGILFALEIIQKFKTDYAGVVISTVVPNFTDILKKAAEAMRAVEEGRQNGFDRGADHTARMVSFRELRSICETLDLSRDQANLLVEGQRSSGRQFACGILVGLVGLAITILFGLPPFIDWLNKPSQPAIAVPAPEQ